MNTLTCAGPAPASEQPWCERDGTVVLLASRIRQRKALHFPPLPATSPLAAGSELVELRGTPRLYSFTIVHASPKVNQPPQALGQVDFPEGVRVFGRIEMPGGRRPVIGEPLQAFIQQGPDGAIYAFRPQAEGGGT
jgi:uncharacterized OB-fold protein